jgi:plasmid stability protein
MEAEAREILSAAVEPAANWLMDLRESCAAVGGVDLDLPRRAEAARSAEFAP